MAGVEVAWWPDSSDPDAPYVLPFAEGFPVTDERGTAFITGLVAGPVHGAVHLTAYALGTQVKLPSLRAVGTQPVEMRMVFGNAQAAAAGRHFPAPWIVRAIDEHGRGVPYAAVVFNGGFDPSVPTAIFNGEPAILAMADEFGFAVSPRPVAGALVGTGFGDACGFDMGCTPFYFIVK
jgi:hypothetical protein